MTRREFQVKSMTAYGRGSSSFSHGSLSVEIQCVNRRYLEMNLSLPRIFARFEMDLRKKISASVGRGMVNLIVNWRGDGQTPATVIPNLTLAKQVKQAWETIAYELGVEARVDLSLLSREKDLLLFEEELPDEALFWKALEKGVDLALGHLLEMKEREGEVLAKDLHARIQFLETVISKIEELAPQGTEKYRQKLVERLVELLEGSLENDERILREVALFAEKVDMTEECVRFKSHLKQFYHMLEQPLQDLAETRGKTLDFLIQELNREINTIGSKSSDLMVSQLVVQVKGEIEKMREQVQNIE